MSRRRAGIVVLLLEQAGLASSCGEGSRLWTAGEEGLLGTLSGNYGLADGIPKVAKSVEGKMSEPESQKISVWAVRETHKLEVNFGLVVIADYSYCTSEQLSCWFIDLDLFVIATND